MKLIVFLLGFCLFPHLAFSQELLSTPIDAAELAAKLGIYMSKFRVDFPEPVFATVSIREGDKVSFRETSKAKKSFCISFEAIPSEIAVDSPKHVFFNGGVTGQDGVDGSSASVTTSIYLSPKFSRSTFSFGNPYIIKATIASPTQPPVLNLPLDQDICLFEYVLGGTFDKTPSTIKVEGIVVFSKTQKKL